MPSIISGRDFGRRRPPASGLIAFGLVTAAHAVAIRLFNGTSSSVSPPSDVWTVAYGAGNNNLLERP